jgi:tellurite resistance protein
MLIRTPKLKLTIKPAKQVDLLAAIFAVNRSAKRYRDAAETHYRERMHGFARTSQGQERASLPT